MRSGRSAGDSPLVVRNQVRLTLAGARAIIAGAEAKAQAMGLKVNIAVVDDGGHLIAFERMDGARPASVYTAMTKATTAATFRQPTGPLPPGTSNPDPLLNLSLQNAAAASGGKITTLYGGVPVVVDGQVIGGVGVGGGTGEQDAQVARAGIAGVARSDSAADGAVSTSGRSEQPKLKRRVPGRGRRRTAVQDCLRSPSSDCRQCAIDPPASPRCDRPAISCRSALRSSAPEGSASG